MGPKWAFKTQTEGLNQQPLGVKHQTAPLHHSGKVSNSWFACVEIAAAPWYKDVFDTMSSCWSLCGPTVSLLTLDKGCGFKSQLMCSNQSANIRVRKTCWSIEPWWKKTILFKLSSRSFQHGPQICSKSWIHVLKSSNEDFISLSYGTWSTCTVFLWHTLSLEYRSSKLGFKLISSKIPE